MRPLDGSGGKPDEVLNGLWGVQSKKVDFDAAVVGFDCCYMGM